VDNGSNILRIAVDGRNSPHITLGHRTRNSRDWRLVALDLSFVQHYESSFWSVDYVITDEDSERSWIGQPIWSEFGEKLA
jgi:hypothetical protein